MSFAPKGHASLDATSPQAFALCDLCQSLWNRSALRPQYQYMGTQLLPTGFLRCSTCLDVPNMQALAISLPPDPVPVYQPRYSKTSSTYWCEFSNPGNAMLLGAVGA